MLGGSCNPCCSSCVDYSVFSEAETLQATVEYEYQDAIGSTTFVFEDPTQVVDSSSLTFANSFSDTYTLNRTSVEEYLTTWESDPFSVNGREMRLWCQINTLPVGAGTSTFGLAATPEMWHRRSSLEFLCVRGIHPAGFTPEGTSPSTGLPLASASGLGHIGIFEQPCGLQPPPFPRSYGQSANAGGPFLHWAGLPWTRGFEPNFTGFWVYGINRDGGNAYGGIRPGRGLKRGQPSVTNLEISRPTNPTPGKAAIAADCVILPGGFTLPIIRGFIGDAPISPPVTQIEYNGSRSISFTDSSGQFGTPGEVLGSEGALLFKEKIVVHSLAANFGGFSQNMLMSVLPAFPDSVWSDLERGPQLVSGKQGTLQLLQDGNFGGDGFNVVQTPCYGETGSL